MRLGVLNDLGLPLHVVLRQAHAAKACLHRLESALVTPSCLSTFQIRTPPHHGIQSTGVESLWSTFKYEYYYRHVFAMETAVLAMVDAWMRRYDARCWHSRIGQVSRIRVELASAAAAATSAAQPHPLFLGDLTPLKFHCPHLTNVQSSPHDTISR